MLEQIKRQARVDINHIPYKGGGQVVTDAAGGHFELFTANPSPGVNGMIAQGKLRVLAVAAPKRLAAMPSIPTLAELGYPAANLTSVFGYFAPARTPPEIVRRLNAEINRILGGKEVQDRLTKPGQRREHRYAGAVRRADPRGTQCQCQGREGGGDARGLITAGAAAAHLE